MRRQSTSDAAARRGSQSIEHANPHLPERLIAEFAGGRSVARKNAARTAECFHSIGPLIVGSERSMFALKRTWLIAPPFIPVEINPREKKMYAPAEDPVENNFRVGARHELARLESGRIRCRKLFHFRISRRRVLFKHSLSRRRQQLDAAKTALAAPSTFQGKRETGA